MPRLVFVNSCNYKSVCSRTSWNPIAASLTKRVDDLVDKVADLKESLEFSQRDIENHKTQINLLDTNLQSAVEEITKLQTPILFKSLQLLKLNDVIESQILSFLYQWSCRLLPPCYREYFKFTSIM